MLYNSFFLNAKLVFDLKNDYRITLLLSKHKNIHQPFKAISIREEKMTSAKRV